MFMCLEEEEDEEEVEKEVVELKARKRETE